MSTWETQYFSIFKTYYVTVVTQPFKAHKQFYEVNIINFYFFKLDNLMVISLKKRRG